MWYIVGAVLLIAIIWFVRSTGKLKRRLKELGAKYYIQAQHMEGLPIPQGTWTYIFACPDKLVMESKKGKFEIPNERIVNYGKVTEQEVLQVNKSVIGRAAVGGLLLGGLGAIIGGMSGIGTKTKTKQHGYFVINYTDRNGETAVISFESPFNIDTFVEEFTKVLNRSKGIEIDPNQTVTL